MTHNQQFSLQSLQQRLSSQNSGKVTPNYLQIASGTKRPPKQCSPLQDSLHCLGNPNEIRYAGVNSQSVFPQFASQPLGMSIDRTLCSKGFKEQMNSLQGSLISPLKGNPKMPSMIKVFPSMCLANFYLISPFSFLNTSGVCQGMSFSWQSFRKLPFFPQSFLKLIKSTEYFIIFRCLAATSPSPPLFPGPISTEIDCSEIFWWFFVLIALSMECAT